MNGSAAISPLEEQVSIEVQLSGRDSIQLDLTLVDGLIADFRLAGIGCPELLKLLTDWRVRLKPCLRGAIWDLPIPEGVSHVDMLLREAILKAQGRWSFPYGEEELCHCRGVATEKVDEAVIGGCHTVAEVSRQTSAGTSCGTCQPDIEAVIRFRLGKKNE